MQRAVSSAALPWAVWSAEIGGRIVNCYAANVILANNNVGGLVGDENGIIENSYWDIQASGISANTGGEGRTSEQLKSSTAADTADPATYTGWKC